MDKISFTKRTATVDLVDYCKSVEEDMFTDLISSKEVSYSEGVFNEEFFKSEAWNDYRKANLRIGSLFDIGVITDEEFIKITNNLFDSYMAYVGSKTKEVK